MEFDVYRSEVDGTIVVHVDTPGVPEDYNGPHVRVYINDDIDNPVFNNPMSVEEKLNGG